MHIGLIGGIGPAATVAYYQRLCAEMRRRQAPLEVTIVHAQTMDVVDRFNRDRREEQAEDYLRLIRRLQAAGADCVAITSLGGHFCFAETRAISPLPLVSAIAPLDEFFASRGVMRIGLLGTRLVMQTRLYGQLARTEAVAPGDDIAEIGQAYQDMAIAGECTEDQRRLFLEAGRRMVEDQGAQAIVLAGTDLNLAFDGCDPGYPVIDALDVHVAVLADLASGLRNLEEVADDQ
ncbi:aspartate/glutamate racemase family protein [Defluviimonas sp. WL0002]|uniref:Aspartate/glutamate racemase family protein n=1 Tax=Albidovulum marisflavi TaxID=2984159 RepID=A0ABT2ZF69_9RHOB|nr:aspartate/glutamate racemase family protein [Defluviimonas sp. WL0002]MCV2869725.1 aspartate/glutamate racemase family protein [Defluviimonas sp. WL0002]